MRRVTPSSSETCGRVGLEVEEVLGLDFGKPPRIPELREVAGGERRALAAVVPAAERGDQDRAFELGRLETMSSSDTSLSLGVPG